MYNLTICSSEHSFVENACIDSRSSQIRSLKKHSAATFTRKPSLRKKNSDLSTTCFSKDIQEHYSCPHLHFTSPETVFLEARASWLILLLPPDWYQENNTKWCSSFLHEIKLIETDVENLNPGCFNQPYISSL